MPIVDTYHENAVGEPRSQLDALRHTFLEHFKSLVIINYTLQSQLIKLDSQYTYLESLADAIANEQKASHRELLLSILDDLKLQGISLSDAEQQTFLEPCPWGQLVKNAQESKLALPADINIAQPDYSTYFKLKRCIAIGQHHQIVSVTLPPANDALHPDILNNIQKICQLNDKVANITFLFFNEYCDNIKNTTREFTSQLTEKKSQLLILHQQALTLATIQIADAKSLKTIAKETLGQEIKKLPFLKVG